MPHFAVDRRFATCAFVGCILDSHRDKLRHAPDRIVAETADWIVLGSGTYRVAPSISRHSLLQRSGAAAAPAGVSGRGAARVQRRPDGVELIVADNGSTDDTVAIASAHGCRVVSTTIRRIGAVRNAGAAAARGAIVAFIDADSQVHPDTFNQIAAWLRPARRHRRRDGRDDGAVVDADRPDLRDASIPIVWATNFDIGVVFCRRADFEAIGGYDESMKFAEDVRFLYDLRRLGRARGSPPGPRARGEGDRVRRASSISSATGTTWRSS